jgi:hypothetical protein
MGQRRADDAGVSRRSLLLGGLALTGTAGAITSTASSAEEPAGWAATFLRQVSEDAFEARLVDGQRVAVSLRPEASVLREGIAGLSDFAPGERIVLEGERLPTGFRATALRLLYERVEARVVAVKGSSVETTAGVIQINGATLARDQAPIGSVKVRARAPHALAAGDLIAVFGRRDPKSGELIALGLGVAAKD